MSLARILAVTERVLRQLWHDKRVLVFMLVLPAIAMLLFGYSFSGDITDVRIAFVDEDKTDLTASILDSLQEDDTFAVTVLDPTTLQNSDPERLLLESGYQGIIRIPDKFTSLYYAHFAMGVATSAQGTIDLTLDESDPQIAATIKMGLADAAMDLGEGGPVEIDTRQLYGVEVRFIDSFAPAIMGLVVALISTVLTLLSIVREKVDGTFSRIWVSPVRRAEFILGYVLAFGLVALVQSLVVLGIGRLVFDIVINGSIAWAFGCVILFAVGSVGLGTLLSALAQTESQAVIFFPLVILPSVLLSGMMWPIQAIPRVLRPLSYLVPLTYSNRLLRAVMVKGLAPWEEPVGFAGVLVFVVVTILLASLVLRQSAGERE
ncbi:ABC transporter permease [Candidatus Bipolaricaulota bacterium]|nr:ABC transporter permease [Candidatus Bipolaricaulota bacterium]